MQIDILLTDKKTPLQVSCALGLSKAFKQLGANVQCIDFSSGNLREHLLQRVVDRADFSLSFTSDGFNMNGTFCWDYFETKHFLYALENPVKELCCLHSKYAKLSVPDAGDFAELKMIDRVHFLPHAVSKDVIGDASAARPYPITFFAHYIDDQEKKRRWPFYFTAPVCELLEAAAEIVLSGTSILAALNQANKSLNVNLLGSKLPFLYQECAEYCKGREQNQLLHALAPLPIHLFGSGWQKVQHQFPHVIWHFPVSYQEEQSIAHQSKVILSHAGLSGAFMSRNKDEIIYMLAHEEKRQESVRLSQELLVKAHTWDHRAEEILRCIE